LRETLEILLELGEERGQVYAIGLAAVAALRGDAATDSTLWGALESYEK
jgi:hypothetical protein